MTIDNTNNPLNLLPLLSEDMKRMLRLWAWRDENFCEALIADPKGVIQQIFPHCFPDGKIADNLTIKVIEEDLFTRHIVLPALADKVPTLEIPEEEQVELLVNLGELGKFKDSYDAGMHAQSQGERKPSFTETQFKKDQAKQTSNESLLKREELARVFSDTQQRDKEFCQKVEKAPSTDRKPNSAMQLLYEKRYLSGPTPKGIEFKVHQNTTDTHHFVVQKLPDHSGDHRIPEDIQESKNRGQNITESGCSQHPQCASALTACCM
jgi:hypothetical protein